MTDQAPNVTQADRDAAAQYAGDAGWGAGSVFSISGYADMEQDELRLVQAFARHRLASTGDDTVLREALEEAREDTHLVAMLSPLMVGLDERLTGERIREAGDRLARIDTALAATPSPDASNTVPWRCFFCDETFTEEALARDHFGFHGWEPGCVNKLVQTDASRRAELVRTEAAFRKAIEERDQARDALALSDASNAKAKFVRCRDCPGGDVNDMRICCIDRPADGEGR